MMGRLNKSSRIKIKILTSWRAYDPVECIFIYLDTLNEVNGRSFKYSVFSNDYFVYAVKGSINETLEFSRMGVKLFLNVK